MELLYLALAIGFTFYSIGIINVYTRPSRRSDPFIIGGLNKKPIRISFNKVLIVVLLDILFWLLFFYKITN